MSNRVLVTLSVTDNGSKVFQEFGKLVDKTGGNLKGMGDKGTSAFKGMSGSIAAGVLQANLLTGALSSAVDVASSLGSAIVGAFQEASQIQLDNVGLAADISAITGKAFSATREELRAISKEVERVGNAFPVADSLIADAQRGFLDDIYSANEEMGRGIDAITKDAASILPRIAVMAEKSNFSASEAARFSSQFINGQLTEAQLLNLDFFNRNKLFMTTVGDYLKDNGKELKELSKQELYNLYQAGLNAQVTDDYVKEAGKTVRGVWNSFTGKLFGENFGMLSLVRDLDDDTKGEQSVIAAAGETLAALFGDEGLVALTANILGKATGADDKTLLETTRSGLLEIKGWIDRLNSLLKTGSGIEIPEFSQITTRFGDEIESLLSGGTDMLADIDFNQLAGRVSDWLSGLLSGATEGLRNFDVSKLGGFFNEVIGSIGEWVSGIDFEGLGGQAGQLLGEVFNTLGELVLSIDWSTIPPILLDAAIGAVQFLAGALGGFVATYDWSLSIRGFYAVFDELWESLIGIVKVGWDSLDGSIKGVFNAASRWVFGKAADIIIVASRLFDRVNGFFNNLLDKIPGVEFRLPTSEAARPAAVRAEEQSAAATAQPVGVDSKAEGNFPGFLGGLLQAVLNERGNMPSGASVVVANDSEMILNRAQQQSLTSNLVRPSTTFKLELGGITIVAGDRDPAALAEQVMRQIEVKFAQFAQSKLSTLAV